MDGGPPQVVERDGERGRNRTYNLLIKSQLLCQLSYAPTVGNLAGRTIKNYNIWSGLFAATPRNSPHSQKAMQNAGARLCILEPAAIFSPRGMNPVAAMMNSDFGRIGPCTAVTR